MYPQQWMSYSMEERRIIADKLQLPRSSGMHIVNNTVVSDGYSIKDLSHITVEKLQEVTGSKKTDMLELVRDLLNPIAKEPDYSEEDFSEEAAIEALKRDKKRKK